MSRRAGRCPLSAILSFTFLLTTTTLADAQGTATPATPAASAARARVSVTCAPCDPAAAATAWPFVDIAADAASADVAVTVGSRDAGQTREWRVDVLGRGRFADRSRTVLVPLAIDAPPADVRTAVTRTIKLVLTEFGAEAGELTRLGVTYRRPAGPAAVPPHDRWNFWVFRLGASAYGSGQSSTRDTSYDFSGSANRTTDQWKVRVSANRSKSRSEFEIDESETIRTNSGDWSTDLLLVRSLGARLSAGLAGSVNGSTYSNTERVARLTPALEFDFFPYAESTKRSLTLQYNVGAARYEYAEMTIFDRLSESVAHHAVGASLGLEQPWGAVGGEFQFTQQLSAPERTRTSVYGSFRVRLLRSLSLNGSGSYSRLRDQFTLVKGEASDDEILLRQRQLATGYRYSMSFGISYSFGALSNATVNPRFNN